MENDRKEKLKKQHKEELRRQQEIAKLYDNAATVEYNIGEYGEQITRHEKELAGLGARRVYLEQVQASIEDTKNHYKAQFDGWSSAMTLKGFDYNQAVELGLSGQYTRMKYGLDAKRQTVVDAIEFSIKDLEYIQGLHDAKYKDLMIIVKEIEDKVQDYKMKIDGLLRLKKSIEEQLGKVYPRESEN